MAGYKGYSMSNNAVDAYATGEKPNSKWTKSDLLDAYKNECNDLGIEVLDLKKLTVANLRFLLLRCSSWHHTSSRFNKTNFYSISTSAVETLTQDAVNELLEQNKLNRLAKKAEKTAPTIEKWEVKFLVWGGTSKNPKATEHIEVVSYDNSKNYVITSQGKKMINANGFEFIKKKDLLPAVDVKPVIQNSYSLKGIPKKQITKEMCLEAVKHNGNELKYIPQKYQTKELCMLAVKQNCNALQYVPEGMKTYELCLEAVKQGGYAIEHVPEELVTEEMCMEAVKQNGYGALKYIPEKNLSQEMCTLAVKTNFINYQYVPEKYRNLDILKEVIKRKNLCELKKQYRTKEICLEAIKQHGYEQIKDILVFYPDVLELNGIPKDIKQFYKERFKTEYKEYKQCLEAVQQDGYAVQDIPKEMMSHNLCMEAVKCDAIAIRYIPEELVTEEMCKIAVEIDPWAIEVVPQKYQTKELCEVAYKKNNYVAEYIPKSIYLCILEESNKYKITTQKEKTSLITKLNKAKSEVNREGNERSNVKIKER